MILAVRTSAIHEKFQKEAHYRYLHAETCEHFQKPKEEQKEIPLPLTL